MISAGIGRDTYLYESLINYHYCPSVIRPSFRPSFRPPSEKIARLVLGQDGTRVKQSSVKLDKSTYAQLRHSVRSLSGVRKKRTVWWQLAL